MKFYTAKVICIEFGISRQTLEEYILKGLFPSYDKSPYRANGVGYFEENFQRARSIPKSPKIADYIKLLKENEHLRNTINETISEK